MLFSLILKVFLAKKCEISRHRWQTGQFWSKLVKIYPKFLIVILKPPKNPWNTLKKIRLLSQLLRKSWVITHINDYLCNEKKSEIKLYTAAVQSVLHPQTFETTHWTANFMGMRKKWFEKNILLFKMDLWRTTRSKVFAVASDRLARQKVKWYKIS